MDLERVQWEAQKPIIRAEAEAQLMDKVWVGEGDVVNGAGKGSVGGSGSNDQGLKLRRSCLTR